MCFSVSALLISAHLDLRQLYCSDSACRAVFDEYIVLGKVALQNFLYLLKMDQHSFT